MNYGLPEWLLDFVAQNPRWLITAGSVLGVSALLYFWTRWNEFIALSVGAFLYMLPFIRLS
jgi:hypothetical protein